MPYKMRLSQDTISATTYISYKMSRAKIFEEKVFVLAVLNIIHSGMEMY